MPKYIKEFKQRIEAMRNPQRAIGAAKFFQSHPGGYGEGDCFYGMMVPDQKALAKEFYQLLTLDELAELLEDPVHDIRITSLMMMVKRFEKSRDEAEKEALVNIYLSHTDYINNWDLVDTSAHYILGPWLMDRSHAILFELAERNHLWSQRIAMIASFHFIRQGQFKTSLKLAEKLLHHKHDLIHKAVGWMLREIGNRDYQTEYDFLLKHYKTMPRTMLRYAIEKFDEPVRQAFLKGQIK